MILACSFPFPFFRSWKNISFSSIITYSHFKKDAACFFGKIGFTFDAYKDVKKVIPHKILSTDFYNIIPFMGSSQSLVIYSVWYVGIDKSK